MSVNSLTWVGTPKAEVEGFSGAELLSAPWTRTSPHRGPSGAVSLTRLHSTEECESGRIGTTGNRVLGNQPWVQIPPPPLSWHVRTRRFAVSDVLTHPKTQVTGTVREAGADFRRARQRSHTWPIATSEPSPSMSDDDAMEIALAEARAAATEGEVPVGAVCLVDGQVVSRRHNERERADDPTAHAELLALRDAAGDSGRMASPRSDRRRHARALPDVRGRPGRCPRRPARLRRVGPQGGRLRDPLQPVCRPATQPRDRRHRWCTRRRMRRTPDLVFCGPTQRSSVWRILWSRSERLGSPLGGVRERPNRTVSKTVVPHGHRGFKSHLLRSGPQGPAAWANAARTAARRWSCRVSTWSSPGGRKGVNRGTRTFDIRKTAARPGQEGKGQGEDGRPHGAQGRQGRRGRGAGAPRRRPTRSTRRSSSSSSRPCTRTWPTAASRSTTSRYAKRSCGPSSSSDAGFASNPGRAPPRWFSSAAPCRALRASGGTPPRWNGPRS